MSDIPSNPIPADDESTATTAAPGPRYKLPLIINLSIIALFFFTFCQVKSCNNTYTPVTGMQLSLRSFDALAHGKLLPFVINPTLWILIVTVLGIIFCFTNPKKAEKRVAICGITGGICSLIFILMCLMFEVRIMAPPFIIAILHFCTPLYIYYGKDRPAPE